MKPQDNKLQIWLALLLIVAGTYIRTLPHPANFAPVAALAIFGGSVLPRKYALVVPLGIMAVSDLFLGYHKLVPVVWGCFLLIAALSGKMLKRFNMVRGFGMALLSSVIFYVVTNFAVWVSGGMYAHTWAGLMECYYMAIPFFRNTLASDLTYTFGIFGVYGALMYTTNLLAAKAPKVASATNS